MGVDYYIGNEQVHLTNYHWYNEFENWVADVAARTGDDYPQILNHSTIEGAYVHSEEQEPTLTLGSIPKLRKEVEELLKLKPSEVYKWVLTQMLAGIAMAETTGHEISLDAFEEVPESKEEK